MLNEGMLDAAAVKPAIFSGFGGEKRIGVMIANFFMSGCCKYPMLLTHDPLKGWPAVKVGWA